MMEKESEKQRWGHNGMNEGKNVFTWESILLTQRLLSASERPFIYHAVYVTYEIKDIIMEEIENRLE